MMEFRLFHTQDPARAEFDTLFRQMNPGREPPPLNRDQSCLLARRDGSVVAKASLEWVRELKNAPGVSGLVGHYDAVDSEAGVALLQEAVSRLKDRGAVRVIGPMNGSTWGTYRLALAPELDEKPPYFLGDVIHPPEYPSHFEKAGFSVVDRYQSRIVKDLSSRHRVAEKILARFERLGGRIEPIDMNCFDSQLQAIFDLSVQAFAKNLYYKTISFYQFQEMMAPMKALLDPEMVLLGYLGDRLVGIIFAYPDLYNPGRVVLKSLATLPQARNLGLGLPLIDKIHHTAYFKGYSSVIHALMHDDNVSLKLSKEFNSQLLRRYQLYTDHDSKIG